MGNANLLAKGHFHLLKNMFDFPLLVLTGIYHYWTYFLFFPAVTKRKGTLVTRGVRELCFPCLKAIHHALLSRHVDVQTW